LLYELAEYTGAASDVQQTLTIAWEKRQHFVAPERKVIRGLRIVIKRHEPRIKVHRFFHART
jgi:hypothetical protein